MTHEEFEACLGKICSLYTCYPPFQHLWRAQNYTLGHCAVVSLLAQRLFGGGLVREEFLCDTLGGRGSHFFNVFKNNGVLRRKNFTRVQFQNMGVTFSHPHLARRVYMLRDDDTARRYAALECVFRNLILPSHPDVQSLFSSPLR